MAFTWNGRSACPSGTPSPLPCSPPAPRARRASTDSRTTRPGRAATSTGSPRARLDASVEAAVPYRSAHDEDIEAHRCSASEPTPKLRSGHSSRGSPPPMPAAGSRMPATRLPTGRVAALEERSDRGVRESDVERRRHAARSQGEWSGTASEQRDRTRAGSTVLWQEPSPRDAVSDRPCRRRSAATVRSCSRNRGRPGTTRSSPRPPAWRSDRERSLRSTS